MRAIRFVRARNKADCARVCETRDHPCFPLTFSRVNDKRKGKDNLYTLD